MVIDFYNRNGGGGGTADYATLAGESDKSKLLEGASAPPQNANTGDVVAIAPNPTRGLRSARTLGIYQYDGTNWNKIEGEGSSAYKIELLEVNPELYTQQDIANLNAFYAAYSADTSIADSAYISALGGIYRCVRYIAIPHSPIFTFEGPFNNNIVDISLIFTNDLFSYGGLQNAVPTPPTPEFTSIKPATDFPEDPVDGEIVLLSEEVFIDYKPEAPNGQTVYGGSLEEFMVAIKGTSNNELWVSTWDDAGHTERTDQGYFHLESDAIDYYDYQGDMDYLFNDLNEGEWVDVNTICLWKEGKNLYFYVKQEAEGVFFRETDSTMEFETVVTDNTLNQYSDGVGWGIFPQALYGRADFPKVGGFGDVVGFGKYEEREATSADVFTSATVTMVNGRATFKMYNPNYGGYCEDYTFGYDVNEGIIGGWGGDNNVINGPWSDHGVEFSIDGDDITFTSQNPEDTEEALLMWGFDPNCNDRITTKELGIYQRDEEGWIEIAKVTDLPADNRLVPEGGSFNDYLRKGGDGPEWVSIRQVPFTDMQKDYTGAVLMSKSIYADEYGWDFIRTDMLNPKSSLPVQGEDGAVYALSSSGYGIVQAQSAHTGQDWFNYNGKSVPSGFTQIRVPYNDTAESNLVHFKTDPNGEGDCNIYWHPEDSSNRRWDGLPNDPAQNDGEFSTTDAWGNTMVGTKVGDYIVVTFGAAVVDGGDPNDPMRADNHTEIYTTGSITDYKSVVMSNSINSIVKLTQAEYDALVSGGTVDANTFYLIISPNS